jgi:drug/metabolite transporter (DMT)-like permease
VSAAYRMRGTDWAQIALLSVAWAGSYLLFRVLVPVLPPVTIALLRVGLGGLFLLGLLAAQGRMLRRPSTGWHSFFVMGLLNNAFPFSVIVWSERQVTAGLAAILIAATPIFTAVLAHVTGHVRLTTGRTVGVVCGFAGVALLIGPAALAGFGASHLAEQLGLLAATVSYAVAGIYGARFRVVPPMQMAAGQLCAAGLLLLPVSLVAEQPWRVPLPGFESWIYVALLVVLCTALPFILFFALLARVGASNVLLVTFLSPVTTLLLGWLLLGETVSGRALVGMAVIVLGLVCIDGRVVRRGTTGVALPDNRSV